MGSAIVNALSSDALFDDIEVYDRSSEKSHELEGVTLVDSIEEGFIDEETVVLVAVKPQDLNPVLAALYGRMVKGSLLVSIAAGVSVERLQKGADCDSVVRVMPNTPITVGEGVSAWFASESVSKKQRDLMSAMFSSFGMEIEVADEETIDKVTPLSGSGPAYVFYFLEALIEGGEALGLDGQQALILAIQTVMGGAAMAQGVHSLDELKQLRANVTSKGGTTERAIQTFDKADLKTIFKDAMKANYDRAKEL